MLLATGPLQAQTFGTDSARAPFVGAFNVLIDGQPDEPFWAYDFAGGDSTWISVGPTAPTDDADFSMRYKVAYDDLLVYFLFDVTDESVVAWCPDTCRQIFRYDNVEVFFNPDYAHTLDSAYGADASQLRFNAFVDNWISGNGFYVGQSTTNPDTTLLQYTSVPTPNGYLLEAAVPWTMLIPIDQEDTVYSGFTVGYFSESGGGEFYTMGFDVNYGDADDRSLSNPREHVMSWHANHVFNFRNTGRFGDLKLGPRLAVAPKVNLNAFTIDGTDGEGLWSQIENSYAVTVPNINANLNAPDDEADFSANFKLAYDDLLLYLYAEVKDESVVVYCPDTCSRPVFQYDNIELIFDVEENVDPAGAYGADGSQVRFNVGRTDNLKSGGGFFMGEATSNPDTALFAYATSLTADGYTLEAAVPWTMLIPIDLEDDYLPEPGTMLRFDISIADADDDTRQRPRESIINWNADWTRVFRDVRKNGILGLADPLMTTSLETAFTKPAIKMYPNPAQHRLTLEAETRMERVRLTNLMGQTLQQQTLHSQQAALDLNGLQPGFYLVTIEMANGQVVSRKFFKE